MFIALDRTKKQKKKKKTFRKNSLFSCYIFGRGLLKQVVCSH